MSAMVRITVTDTPEGYSMHIESVGRPDSTAGELQKVDKLVDLFQSLILAATEKESGWTWERKIKV